MVKPETMSKVQLEDWVVSNTLWSQIEAKIVLGHCTDLGGWIRQGGLRNQVAQLSGARVKPTEFNNAGGESSPQSITRENNRHDRLVNLVQGRIVPSTQAETLCSRRVMHLRSFNAPLQLHQIHRQSRKCSVTKQLRTGKPDPHGALVKPPAKRLSWTGLTPSNRSCERSQMLVQIPGG